MRKSTKELPDNAAVEMAVEGGHRYVKWQDGEDFYDAPNWVWQLVAAAESENRQMDAKIADYFTTTIKSLRTIGDHKFAESMEKFTAETFGATKGNAEPGRQSKKKGDRFRGEALHSTDHSQDGCRDLPTGLE